MSQQQLKDQYINTLSQSFSMVKQKKVMSCSY